jgi:iron-sulfur cluster repair protein YtfE (RIC family)
LVRGSEGELPLHFRKEEEVLLPVMARRGGDVTRDPVVEMLEGHARIRGLVMRLSDEVVGGNVRPETRPRSGIS